MKKKLITFSEVKKDVKKKKINQKKSDLGTLSRTFLASVIIMTSFFVSPVFVEFLKNTSLTSIDFENNSKNSLKNLLEEKKK